MEELKKKIDEAMNCQFVGEVIFTEDMLCESIWKDYGDGFAADHDEFWT